jgi:methylase of polypeptide subunit release factors
MFQHLAEEFPKNPVRTLEVGCGSGGVSLYFHNTCIYEVELVDLSNEALSFAQRNCPFEATGTTDQEIIRHFIDISR